MSHTSDILAQAQALGANLDLGLPEPAASQRVVVAMSGGVDSTLVAALLKLYGYDVVGITLQLYDTGQMAGKPGSCCAGRDIADARRAAQSLDFPHYVLNFENRFRDAVMEDFADTYLAGATPVPCIRCNQSVKFSDLLAVTKDLGAKAMATGHYVRRCEGPAGPMLTPAAETGRDQSWFLFATTSEQLQSLRFPLGGMKKQAVRDIALALKLDVADKPDSQDICFVTGNYAQTLEKLRPGAGEAGRIIHIDGQDLGEHAGIIHYTVGQRRGLRIGGGDPLYVVRLDPKRREVIVGPRSALQIAALTLGETNWLGPHTLESACHAKMPARARVRSGCTPSPGRLAWIDAMPGFVFDTGEEGVAPGQACVLHDAQDRILGGGFIRATRSAYVQAANQASENSMSYVPENAQ